MKQAATEIRVQTRGRGLYEITEQVAGWVARQGVATGLVTLFIRHTSASLVVQENADPDVVRDLNDFFGRLAPDGHPSYRHTIEGVDDMPAHIRAALTNTQLGVPLIAGRMALGTWQGIYVFEHRTRPHSRAVAVHVIGE